MQYRRAIIPQASYFFTLDLLNRKSSLLTEEFDKLKFAISTIKSKHPFKIDAMVVMPDHLHILMTLLENSNYSQIWNLIKGNFSRQIINLENISLSRKIKRERGIWQRRFWEHVIRDENDYENHVNYIHINPVKHGYVKNPADWEFSSIHRYIRNGVIDKDWACNVDFGRNGFGSEGTNLNLQNTPKFYAFLGMITQELHRLI